MWQVLILTTISSAFATSFFSQPFEKTLTDAPVIIRGKTGAGQSRYSTYSDGKNQLFTFTEIEVTERLKGADSMPGKIEIREIGGKKNGIEMGVSGSAEFTPGEEVVLLLNQRAQDGSYPLKGLMMGKYTIEKDRAGNEILKGAGIESAQGHSHDEAESEHEEKKVWTLKALREFIAENKTQPSVPAVTEVARSTGSPIPSVSPSPEPQKEEIHEDLVAPEEGNQPSGNSTAKMVVKFMIALLIGGAFYLLRRRRR